MLDSILCDELVQEIFHRLPQSSSSSVSLVCKRWRRLLRSCTVALSLSFDGNTNPSILPSLSSFLSHHPYLSSLSLTTTATPAVSPDQLLRSVALSCPNLRRFRFLTDPVSVFSLLSLSNSCPHLSSLAISLRRPLCFQWLPPLRALKELSLLVSGGTCRSEFAESLDVELNLESLCLAGIQVGDYGLSYLWRNCKKIKKLELKRCEGVGDNTSFSAFVKSSSQTLCDVELRTCRTVVDGVLLKLAENCVFLNSLLVYDGGNKEGLLQFVNRVRYSVQKLDLRLPLDLDDDHLMAIARKFRALSSLRLQSCCLVSGEGLQAIGRGLGDELEELALINCEVVERESGVLASLGQDLKRLRKLDLSCNEMLLDKELSSMLVSCGNLNELKLRGCNRLSGAAMVSIARHCRLLETLDVMYCCGIESEAVECFLGNSSHLIRLLVEDCKLSVAARMLASDKFVELVD